MANLEHLAKLEEGVDSWNQWRKGHQGIQPDLSTAKLQQRDLSSADFHETDLTGSWLGFTHLHGANFRTAILRDADLTGAGLIGADFTCATATRARLHGTDLRNACLTRADLRGSDLHGANLGEAVDGAYADLSYADLSGADLSEAVLFNAHLIGANLTEADLRIAHLHRAMLDNAILTAAKLWETQRAGWSIKGIICGRAYWDEKGVEVTLYTPGEFERLHSEQPRIELLYKGGITKFEVTTLPALLYHLADLHPSCSIRLKSIEEAAGGSKVSISVEGADESGRFEEIKAVAERLQGAQIALRYESRRAERLEIEKRMLLEEVFPRMLSATGPQVQIAGAAAGVVIAGGNASVHAQQTVNDLTPIRPLLESVMSQRGDLGLASDQAVQLEKAIREVQQELQNNQPRYSVVSGGLRIVRDFIVGALGNAAGTALATNNWQPLLDQLGRLLNQLRW